MSMTCVLCKEEATEQTPFMVIPESCLCSSKTGKRIHYRCAKIFPQLHQTITKKYTPAYKMCRICEKQTANISYKVGENTITIKLEDIDPFQGWQPSELHRTQDMRSSGHKYNYGLIYTNSAESQKTFHERWYYPVEDRFTKPMLMKTFTMVNRAYEGVYKTYFTHGKLNEEINYVRHRKHGINTMYHSNGKIYTVKMYVNGENTGENLRYDDKGQLMEKYTVTRGLMDGHYESWYTPTQKHKDLYYRLGSYDYSKHLLTYHSDGKIMYECKPIGTDTTGKAILLKKMYFQNGQLENEVKCQYDPKYENYLRPIEFPIIFYNRDGSICSQITKTADNKIKVESFFAGESQRKMSVYYLDDKGRKTGLYCSWYKTGSRETMCCYRKGRFIDEYIKWDSSGNLLKYGKHDSNERFISEVLNIN